MSKYIWINDKYVGDVLTAQLYLSHLDVIYTDKKGYIKTARLDSRDEDGNWSIYCGPEGIELQGMSDEEYRKRENFHKVQILSDV